MIGWLLLTDQLWPIEREDQTHWLSADGTSFLKSTCAQTLLSDAEVDELRAQRLEQALLRRSLAELAALLGRTVRELDQIYNRVNVGHSLRSPRFTRIAVTEEHRQAQTLLQATSVSLAGLYAEHSMRLQDHDKPTLEELVNRRTLRKLPI
jgi:hypothetical protein